jgi:hypothetical protein
MFFLCYIVRLFGKRIYFKLSDIVRRRSPVSIICCHLGLAVCGLNELESDVCDDAYTWMMYIVRFLGMIDIIDRYNIDSLQKRFTHPFNAHAEFQRYPVLIGVSQLLQLASRRNSPVI